MTEVLDAALSVTQLRVELPNGDAIVDNVDLLLRPGEILGLVGESGAGKTTTALALFGCIPQGLTMSVAEMTLAGDRIEGKQAFRHARGRVISYVPQNPGTSLNPSMRVADALADILRAHRGKEAAAKLPYRVLERVGLPGTGEFGRRYPHQLSGGQQQRVCVGAAIAPSPTIVVLDEPTTGLDVVTQDHLLKELVRLRDEEQVAMLYITHNLAVVAQIAQRIAVMYGGHIVEQGPARAVLESPHHPYTRGLVAATPDHLRARLIEGMPGIAVGVGERLSGCRFASRCTMRAERCELEMPELLEVSSAHDVRCFEWRRTPAVSRRAVIEVRNAVEGRAKAERILTVQHLRAAYRGRYGNLVAVSDVSFELAKGACVALVGESGSGKTTIARVIAGLHPLAAGQILLDGVPLVGLAQKRTIEQRRRIQIVFQNPAEALNPRHTVAEAIARPAWLLRRLGKVEAQAEVERLLAAVRLPVRLGARYPRELSGGERQRVAIARALAANPEVIICDEITSALDVSVQAVVLDLLRDLRRELGTSLVFITHDLGVVASIADEILVLQNGVLCEAGHATDVLTSPQNPYTCRLLAAAPSVSVATNIGDVGADAVSRSVPG